MKLQILVPRHNEEEALIRRLLDSIALQQCADFGEVGVIILDDGSEELLRDEIYEGYPFRVDWYWQQNKGVSAARNTALGIAEAEYVMFADADDMFMDACGLWLILREIGAGFDCLVSMFTEELHKDGEIIFVDHERDCTFVHGKVFRREYLRRNGILFNEKLKYHEDSYFNVLAQSCTENIKYLPHSFYLWKWRDGSVCRSDPDFLLKTYPDMIASNDALLDALLGRSRYDRARETAAGFLLDVYYAMQRPEWTAPEHADYRAAAERRFASWYFKYDDLWKEMPENERAKLSEIRRKRSVIEGMGMEAQTVGGWLDDIMKILTGG